MLAGAGSLTQVSTSSGLPTAILPRCRMVWTGGQAEDMKLQRRKQLRLTYSQWKAEGLQCMAFSLVPIDSRGIQKEDASKMLQTAASSSIKTGRPLVTSLRLGRQRKARPSIVAGKTATSRAKAGGAQKPRPQAASAAAVAVLEDSGDEGGEHSGALPVSEFPMVGSGVEDHFRQGRATRRLGADGRLRSLRRDHVLLGMVAARQDPLRKVQRAVGMLDAAAVRFVFASADRFAPAKPLADRMGLSTGWNTSVSLRGSKPAHGLAVRKASLDPGAWLAAPDTMRFQAQSILKAQAELDAILSDPAAE